MKKHLPAIIIFFVLIIVTTYPLVLKITNHIPGFFSTDEIYAPIWGAWRIKFCLLNGLSTWKTDFIAYPFGMDFFSNLPIGYLWYLINYTLAIFTTPVLTYNLQVIFNLFLLAYFTYLLAYYLSKNKLVAVFSAIIYGFSPYVFMRTWQHLAELYHWTLPLFLLAVFRLIENRGPRTKILFIVSFILTSINFTDTFLASIVLSLFLAYFLLSRRGRLKDFKEIIVLSLVAFLFLLPTFFPFFKNILFNRNSIPSSFNTFHRPFVDLIAQSARPLSYFLPAVTHPLFGRITSQMVGSQLYGISYTEHTLYLGWTPIILSFIAYRGWRIRRKNCKSPALPAGRQSPGSKFQINPNSQAPNSKLQANELFYIGFFVWLAIAAWFCSQPPWWQWGSLKIFMPSFFVYRILPMFRAYSRFGIVVLLAIAVLAGFGLKLILERFKSKKIKIAITALFCSLVLFEFWSYPPFKVIDVSRIPQAYYWLKEQPEDFVIAEYPLIENCPIELYRFYQTKHHKKMINGTIPGTYPFKVSEAAADLSDKNTPSILKWMGVKYVLVHWDWYLEFGQEDKNAELSSIPKNPGLKLVKSFAAEECPDKDIMCVQKTGPIDIYEIVTTKRLPPPVKE